MNLFDSPLLLSKNDGLQIEQKIVKRLLDIAISAVGLLITSPLFLLIAISIKCTDRGPVFYKQKRLTQGGKEFKIFGDSGLDGLAEELDLPILGRMPIEPKLAELADGHFDQAENQYLSMAEGLLMALEG